jgi:hypothetical protein
VADQVPGALGQPNTVPTTNSDTFSQGMRLGGKLTANYWLTDQPESLGLQASGFIMRQATSSFVQASAGGTADPVVARPFFNGPLGREDSDPRAIPGALGGNVGIEFQTRMIGAEGSVICNLTGFSPTGPSVFALLGPRFLKFDERYFSNEFTIDLPPTPVNSFLIQDKFTCYNEFLGAQIGAQFRYRWEGVTFDLIGKFAMGRNHETLMIDGQTVITNQVTGARVGGRQGLFAQPSNIGEYTQNSLSMIPELALNLTVDVAPNLKVLFGYGFMYMTNVARPAENLDRNVNIQPLGAPTQIGPPLPLRPTSIAETNLWSNAFSFGVQLVF